jgi:AraC-like DNA-binding protein
LFGPVSDKVALIAEMEKFGYEIVWEKGIFDSLYLINAIKYLTLYGYTFLITSLLIWSYNYKRLPKHLLMFFKLAIVFLIINLIPNLISHFGLDIWNYASLIGAASTLLFTFGVFLLPDFLFPKEESSPIGFDWTKKQECPIADFETEQPAIRNTLLFDRIETYFKENKPFLDQDFSLSHVEKHLCISGRYISEAIKKETQLNFSAYVNQARITYLKEYLSKESNIKGKSVDEIATELGFRSVNSFYQVVRKTKGCTPKEFLEAELKSNSYDLVTGSGI